MSDTPSFQKDRSDDLDLTPVAVKAIRFIRQYGWKLAIGAFLGMIIGAFIYYLLPRNYKARMVVQSGVIANGQALRIVNNWEDLLNKNSRPIIATIFQQPLQVVSEISTLNAEVITGPDENSGMVIDVTVGDSAALPGVQQGILHGLETNEYIKERLAIRRENLEWQLSQAKAELVRLDSIKPYVKSFTSANEPANSRLLLDVSDISSEKLAYQEKIAAFQEKLKFLRGAWLLQELLPVKRAKLVPAPVLPLLGLVLGFLLSYCAVMYSILSAKYLASEKSRVTP